MKWFHHETAARHDPKLQMLGSSHGAEGLGIFWGLLEEIGQHSDTFYLKILGISEEADETFMNLLTNPGDDNEFWVNVQLDLRKIPKLTAKILAKNLFTSVKKLKSVIQTSVDVGLFASDKWLKFNVLHSPSFEHRADDYTRRQQRRLESVRTTSEQKTDNRRSQSEQGSDDVRRESEKVPPETEKEIEAEQKQKEKRETEKDMLAINTPEKNQPKADDLSTGRLAESLTQSDFYNLLKDEPYLIELSEEGFREYSREFRSVLSTWNDGRPNRFDWSPVETELRKLFFGGEHEHKVTMCYHAFKLLGEKVHYPELVLRALKMMLRSSEKSRIINPFGWIWTCLHGNGDGTTPWVQLLTAEEENSNPGSRSRLQ
jgi:hypothetical protein